MATLNQRHKTQFVLISDEHELLATLNFVDRTGKWQLYMAGEYKSFYHFIDPAACNSWLNSHALIDTVLVNKY